MDLTRPGLEEDDEGVKVAASAVPSDWSGGCVEKGERMPLFDVFWTMLWFFLFFIWIMLVVRVFADIFRSHDLSGWGKAGWTLAVVLVPLLGVLVYVIARGDSMQKRQMEDATVAKQRRDESIRQSATSDSSTDELAKLARLHDDGTISDAEFQQAKSKVLAA